MLIHESNYDLASPEYVRNAERILNDWACSEHRVVKAALHGKPVYVVTDMALAKKIFEDGKNFSFSPVGLSADEALTEGARAFVDQGLSSALLSSEYDEYKNARRLFNQALNISYTDRTDVVEARARLLLSRILDGVNTPTVDALALCQQYWLPLVAEIIGISSLSFDELAEIARCARAIADGNGLHGDREAIDVLARANSTIERYLEAVVEAGPVPTDSALGYFLREMAASEAITCVRTFVLGGMDTGGTALEFGTYQLAADPNQRARFLAMGEQERRLAMTELVSREAPAYHSPRFAVRDITIEDLDIPAGTFIQLAMYGLNRCANSGFNIDRWSKTGCPVGRNETLPFGHARHRCPGEELVRHLNSVFLGVLFTRYPEISIRSVEKECNAYSRGLSELILTI